MEYLKSAPKICEVGNAAVDLARAVRMRGRREISELDEFSIIRQQSGSDKGYLPDKEPVWIIHSNVTANLHCTKYRLNIGDYFLRFIFIDSRPR